jgi:(E)-4-hydroxy-3-methylbut-2-enyl-diphosphate synthase
VDLVSCPTCGRTKIDLEALANEVDSRLRSVEERLLSEGRPGIKVAVMGCAVNGPGEAKEADFGVAGGLGEGLIFRKGEIIKKVPEDQIVDQLFEIIEQYIQ